MVLRYTVTVDDFVEFNREVSATNPEVRRVVARARWGVSGVMVGLGALTAVPFGWPAAAVGLVAGAIFAYRYPNDFRKQMDKQVRKTFDAESDRGVLGAHTLELLHDCMLETTAFGENRVKWHGISEVLSTSTHTFIRMGPAFAYVVPRPPADADDHDAFMDELRARIDQQLVEAQI